MISHLLANEWFQLTAGALALYVVIGRTLRSVLAHRRRHRPVAFSTYRTYPTRPPV